MPRQEPSKAAPPQKISISSLETELARKRQEANELSLASSAHTRRLEENSILNNSWRSKSKILLNYSAFSTLSASLLIMLGLACYFSELKSGSVVFFETGLVLVMPMVFALYNKLNHFNFNTELRNAILAKYTPEFERMQARTPELNQEISLLESQLLQARKTYLTLERNPETLPAFEKSEQKTFRPLEYKCIARIPTALEQRNRELQSLDNTLSTVTAKLEKARAEYDRQNNNTKKPLLAIPFTLVLLFQANSLFQNAPLVPISGAVVFAIMFRYIEERIMMSMYECYKIMVRHQPEVQIMQEQRPALVQKIAELQRQLTQQKEAPSPPIQRTERYVRPKPVETASPVTPPKTAPTIPSAQFHFSKDIEEQLRISGLYVTSASTIWLATDGTSDMQKCKAMETLIKNGFQALDKAKTLNPEVVKSNDFIRYHRRLADLKIAVMKTLRQEQTTRDPQPQAAPKKERKQLAGKPRKAVQSSQTTAISSSDSDELRATPSSSSTISAQVQAREQARDSKSINPVQTPASLFYSGQSSVSDSDQATLEETRDKIRRTEERIAELQEGIDAISGMSRAAIDAIIDGLKIDLDDLYDLDRSLSQPGFSAVSSS